MLSFVNIVLKNINMDDEEFDIEDVPEIEELPPMDLLSRKHFLESDIDKSNPKEDFLWVYQALGAEGLKKGDAPSPGAWSLLQSLMRDDLAKKSFFTTVLPKLLPGKSEMEKNDRAEDGRKCFDLIERLLREPDDNAAILSDVEKRAVKDGTRQLELSQACS